MTESKIASRGVQGCTAYTPPCEKLPYESKNSLSLIPLTWGFTNGVRESFRGRGVRRTPLYTPRAIEAPRWTAPRIGRIQPLGILLSPSISGRWSAPRQHHHEGI